MSVQPGESSRQRTPVLAVVSALSGIGAAVLAELVFTGGLGFAPALLAALFLLSVVAMVTLVLAVVRKTRG